MNAKQIVKRVTSTVVATGVTILCAASLVHAAVEQPVKEPSRVSPPESTTAIQVVTTTPPQFRGADSREIDFSKPCTQLRDASNRSASGPRQLIAPKPDPSHPLATPNYPPAARRAGEEGTAMISLLINEQGEVARARLSFTSGSSLLDRSALEGTQRWTFVPGRDATDPICMWVTVPVVFRLDETLSSDQLRAIAPKPATIKLADKMLSLDGELAVMKPKLVADLGEDGVAMVTRVFAVARSRNEVLEQIRFAAANITYELSEQEIGEISLAYEKPALQRLVFDGRLGNDVARRKATVFAYSMCSASLVMQSSNGATKESRLKQLGALTDTELNRAVDELSRTCTCVSREFTLRTGSRPAYMKNQIQMIPALIQNKVCPAPRAQVIPIAPADNP